MKLERVILQGFRGYRDRTEIPISQLTAFIGANDIGKSTVLEALDAFFNDNVDPQDANTRAAERRFTIGCVFSDLPDQINLDTQSTTTLSDEFLLNHEGKLELYKVWKATTTRAEVERVFARSHGPIADSAEGLLFRKRDELKKVVEEKQLEADKRKNPEMRRAIYASLQKQGDWALGDREVDLDRPKDRDGQFEDARRIWKKLSDRHLPVYSLFKSEQVRGDRETAVRSPLDATLKNAIKELEDDLSPLAEQIQEQVKATTERTLERLQRDYPEIARTLIPKYKAPNWSKAFDLDVLQGDDDIPLNKRGAGVRRLVVLAFFQAEAERKRSDRAEGVVVPPVIYAIEEPETSQHPDFQKNIIQSLEALADAGDQVLLTTHVPGLAELLPVGSIRYIDRPEENTSPRIRSGAEDKDVLSEAAHSLGVLPSALPSRGAQIAVWVEGETDVWVLDAVAEKLAAAGDFPEPLDPSRLYFVIGAGGDKLKGFVNGEYLQALGLPQFYLRDSDRQGPSDDGKPIPEEVSARVEAWEKRGEGVPIKVVRTHKREIENYMHCDAVDRVVGVNVDLENLVGEIDWDFTQISKSGQPVWQTLKVAKKNHGFVWPVAMRRGIETDYKKPKHVICGLVIPEMTLEELRQRCASTDIDASASEIDKWFLDMAELVRTAQ